MIIFQLYEDEKSNSERLKRELSDTKKELLEAKGELDRLLKRSEQSRLSDTNEKRVSVWSPSPTCPQSYYPNPANQTPIVLSTPIQPGLNVES